jgi:hypothetical protein
MKDYPLTLNILITRLNQEKKDLTMWNNIISQNRNPLSVRQAQGNISSTQHRINELIEVLSIIKNQVDK